jgi:hypothetical protein
MNNFNSVFFSDILSVNTTYVSTPKNLEHSILNLIF